jgi:hypothetical protein
MAARMTTSSQSHLQKVTRKCATENCNRSAAKDETFGLCPRCYAKVRQAEKKRKATGTTETLRPCASRELDLVLPERRPFEWLGSLTESVRAMQSEE